MIKALGHARANRQTFAHEAGIAHLVAMVVEVRPSVVNAFADLLRERTLTRQAHSLGGEYIKGIDVVLEFAAVLVQPGRTFGFGAAVRIERQSDFSNVFCGRQKKSISWRSVCCSRKLQLLAAPSAMPR